MKKQELQKLISSEELKNQDNLRSDLEKLLKYNIHSQDSDIIALDNNLSLNVYKFLLENGFDPNEFLEKVTHIFYFDQEGENSKLSLIELALSFRADPNILRPYLNVTEKDLDILMSKGLTYDHALKLILNQCVDKYDAETQNYKEDQEKINLRDKIALDLISKGADLNHMFKNPSYYPYNMADFINANEEYLLNYPIHPLTPNNYLNAALKIKITNTDGVVKQIRLEQQHKMLEKAFSIGGDIHKELNNREILTLEQLEFTKDLIVKYVGATYLLLWCLRSASISNEYDHYGRAKSEEEKAVNTQSAIELVKFAIANGADVNYNYSGDTAIDLTEDEEIIALLKAHGAEPSNTHIEEFYQNGLHHLFWQPKVVLDKKYKNLDAQESVEAKMPYLVHHIWLTHPSNPQEIRSQDIENAVKTKEIFTKSNVSWNHIVWTNDKNLIPESTQKLSEHGIEIRSIYEHQDVIASIDLVTNLIEQKMWGMASDTLRYSIVEEFGGVYADINYIFNRDVTSEAHKYNFFTCTYQIYYIDNFFFGASPHHPVVQKMVEITERNLINPPEYIARIQNQDSRVITDMGTANPTFIAYYLEANNHGNLDVVYPITKPISSLRDPIDDYRGEEEQDTTRYFEMEKARGINDHSFDYFLRHLFYHEICGADRFYIGHDSADGNTWLSS